MSNLADQPKQATTVWPVAVRIVDLDRGDPSDRILEEDHSYRSLLVIGRRSYRPIGELMVAVRERTPHTRAEVQEAFAALGGADHGAQTDRSELDVRLQAIPADISVVVPTTGGDVNELVDCIGRLIDQQLPPLEVIVVDNRPTHRLLQETIAASFADEPRVRLVEEPVKGLAAARNAGLKAARGEFVAFVDDDVQADSRWLANARLRFEEERDIACVTGLIIPSELESEAQWLFDRFAGFAKGFQARTYRLSEPPADEPLFPYTPGRFGSGANAVFRRSELAALGGYDTRLGAGTPASGGEDIDMYFRVVTSGRALSYEPAAIVWHRHPRSLTEVREHIYTYGVGLGAVLAKQALNLRTDRELLRRLPAAVLYLLDPRSDRNARKGRDFPRRFSLLELLGVAYGPIAYARSRWAAATRTA